MSDQPDKHADVLRSLGVQRRREPPAAAAALAPAEGEAAPEPAGGEAAPEPAAPAPAAAAPQGLGNDATAPILANLFKIRPGLREKLPPRLLSLQRTHGHYMGDGRAERKLPLGWEPALILYVVPPYPDGQPPFAHGRLSEPGLHRQPTLLPDGFQVDAETNRAGDFYLYVAFKSDGQPLLEEDKRGRGDGRGLGLRRRRGGEG